MPKQKSSRSTEPAQLDQAHEPHGQQRPAHDVTFAEDVQQHQFPRKVRRSRSERKAAKQERNVNSDEEARAQQEYLKYLNMQHELAERDAVFLRQPQLYHQQQMDYNQEDDEDVDWKQQQDARRDEQQRHMNLLLAHKIQQQEEQRAHKVQQLEEERRQHKLERQAEREQRKLERRNYRQDSSDDVHRGTQSSDSFDGDIGRREGSFGSGDVVLVVNDNAIPRVRDYTSRRSQSAGRSREVRVRRSWGGNEDSDPPSLDDSALAYRPPPHGAGRVPAVGSASSLTTGNAAVRRSAEQFFSAAGGPPTFIQSDQSLQLSRDSIGSSDPDNNVQPSHVSRARTRAPPIPVRHVRSGSSPREQRQQASPRLAGSPSQTFVHGGISIAFSTTPPKDQRPTDSGTDAPLTVEMTNVKFPGGAEFRVQISPSSASSKDRAGSLQLQRQERLEEDSTRDRTDVLIGAHGEKLETFPGQDVNVSGGQQQDEAESVESIEQLRDDHQMPTDAEHDTAEQQFIHQNDSSRMVSPDVIANMERAARDLHALTLSNMAAFNQAQSTSNSQWTDGASGSISTRTGNLLIQQPYTQFRHHHQQQQLSTVRGPSSMMEQQLERQQYIRQHHRQDDTQRTTYPQPESPPPAVPARSYRQSQQQVTVSTQPSFSRQHERTTQRHAGISEAHEEPGGGQQRHRRQKSVPELGHRRKRQDPAAGQQNWHHDYQQAYALQPPQRQLQYQTQQQQQAYGQQPQYPSSRDNFSQQEQVHPQSGVSVGQWDAQASGRLQFSKVEQPPTRQQLEQQRRERQQRRRAAQQAAEEEETQRQQDLIRFLEQTITGEPSQPFASNNLNMPPLTVSVQGDRRSVAMADDGLPPPRMLPPPPPLPVPSQQQHFGSYNVPPGTFGQEQGSRQSRSGAPAADIDTRSHRRAKSSQPRPASLAERTPGDIELTDSFAHRGRERASLRAPSNRHKNVVPFVDPNFKQQHQQQQYQPQHQQQYQPQQQQFRQQYPQQQFQQQPSLQQYPQQPFQQQQYPQQSFQQQQYPPQQYQQQQQFPQQYQQPQLPMFTGTTAASSGVDSGGQGQKKASKTGKTVSVKACKQQ